MIAAAPTLRRLAAAALTALALGACVSTAPRIDAPAAAVAEPSATPGPPTAPGPRVAGRCVPRPPKAGKRPVWRLSVASWNLLNLGNRKIGLPPYGPLRAALVQRYAGILSRFDIILVQELLNQGDSWIQAIANDPRMANYNCQYVSSASGRRGRQERFGICYATARLTLHQPVTDLNGTTVVALDGSLQTAQNVWMRPPIEATFTLATPKGPFTFSVFDNHTKPAYGVGARPPGTPPNALNNQSVTNELTSLEQNGAGGRGLQMVLGDLNADCASYPARDRGSNFDNGWTWCIDYGEKTNTAANSSCAYDRILLSDALKPYYRDHGILTAGINQLVAGKRVSDHYLVWVVLGEDEEDKPRLLASSAEPVRAAKRQRAYTKDRPIYFNGRKAPRRAATAPQLCVVPYSSKRYFDGNQTYPLDDVRGSCTRVSIQDDGKLSPTPQWPQPQPGIYSLVLDVNGDGWYNKNDGDLVNYDNEIDFIVDFTAERHSDLVTLGDNGKLRELFNENVAVNIYALGDNLPAGRQVDTWVVSRDLLPTGWTTWEKEREKGTLDLATVSIPIHRTTGILYVDELTVADKKTTLQVADDGTLFVSAWPRPYVLFNMRALTAPPPLPIYRPEYAEEDIDPCWDAWESDDENFQEVCNVGNLFSDYYGTTFNYVVDVNRNGVFDDGDRVDTYDIGDLKAYFADPSHTVLDGSADGDPAVSEYKVLLDTKLNLTEPLPGNDIYGPRTEEASEKFLCSPDVPRERFPIVEAGAQTGFRVVDQDTYLKEKELATGNFYYDNAEILDTDTQAGAQVCVTANQLRLADFTTQENSQANLRANELRLDGPVTVEKNSTACLMATTSLTLAAGTGAVAVVDPEPVSKVGAALFTVFEGAVGLGSLAVCKLGY